MERRKFIQNSIIGAAGLTIGGSGIISASCMGANDKIVLALIGAGSRGTGTIIDTCRRNENVEIKTVCDVKSTQVQNAVAEIEKELGYRPGTTNNMKEIFDDKEIDAVWISTPEHWHALATVWACQAGKDVYVEKNPTLSVWEGRKMIEAAAKYDRIVQIGFQNRSAAYGFSARDYIGSGKLGKIVHVKCYNMLGGSKWMPSPDEEIPQWIDWDAWVGPAPYRPFNPNITTPDGRGGWLDFWAFGGGALSDDASHVLDLARLVLGDPAQPKSIFACGGNRPWGSEKETPEFLSITYDFEDFTMTCDSGNATNYMKKTPGEIRRDPGVFPDWRTNSTRTEIYGTEGMMYLGRHGGGWQVIGENSEIIAQEGATVPDEAHQKDFIESLRTRKKPNGDVEQGHLSACLVHFGNIAYRAGNKQLLFDAEKEQFINDDEANKFLKSEYRENYAIPESV
ncbi:MAG TPA: Gfo/Idh/MocA family oxidoreductase [Mariniphaga anaerophila]|uniref:Gfo/Idh/MocA family oxidoreductase n=1 Tax=Mariniphaga anaerophila TaxID=1484053 RepID=A0A831LNA0_9BACT|nr:Gfo/Idh/MocA family oxidoreductase [Mariniphaga anaerophila]